MLRGQAKWFRERGYEVHLVSGDGTEVRELARNEGAIFHPIRIERRIGPHTDVFTLLRLVRLFRTIRPDVVNVGTPKMGLLGTIAARMAGVRRVIYTCRGLRYEHERGWIRRVLKGAERVSGRLAQTVVCVGPALREQAVADHTFPEAKSVVLGKGSSNGVDPARVGPDRVDVHARADLETRHDLRGRFVFGFVGRLVDRKGVHEVVTAFERVQRAHPDTLLLMVGPHDLSQLSDPSILRRIDEHPSIRRTGYLPDAASAMSLMDVLVVPSWWEGFGNVFLEAAAMGVPVVTSNGTGCRDAVLHGFNGTVVPVRDIAALEGAMRRYVHDPETRASHGRNGQLWAREFLPERIWGGLDALYRDPYVADPHGNAGTGGISSGGVPGKAAKERPS